MLGSKESEGFILYIFGSPSLFHRFFLRGVSTDATFSTAQSMLSSSASGDRLAASADSPRDVRFHLSNSTYSLQGTGLFYAFISARPVL